MNEIKNFLEQEGGAPFGNTALFCFLTNAYPNINISEGKH
jgi:hypothetical protein